MRSPTLTGLRFRGCCLKTQNNSAATSLTQMTGKFAAELSPVLACNSLLKQKTDLYSIFYNSFIVICQPFLEHYSSFSSGCKIITQIYLEIGIKQGSYTYSTTNDIFEPASAAAVQSVEQMVGSVHGELRRDGDSKEFLRDVQRLLITGSNLLLH